MAYDVKRTLRENLLAILQHRGGELRGRESGVSRLTKLGIALGNAQRLLDEETSIGVKLLGQVAEALGVQPWQLLVPELDPAALPGLTVDQTAWPFPMVDRALWKDLGPNDRVFVQGALAQAIKERHAAVPKQRRASA